MRQWTGWTAVAAAGLGLAMMTAAGAQAPAAPAPGSYTALYWRYVGPPGNRTDAVSGVPGDPMTYYSGTASGGIFKTTDGGLHWQAIFDHEPVLSIGALAVASSDHNVVWAGTGEAFIRSHISIGDGVYKSTDAGATWQHMGLDQTGRIARIVIDPTNPDVVLACALGTTYGPQPERGVYRSADGGATWTKSLFVDENTGCNGLAMDPSNPRILFAGMWQFVQHTWNEDSGGPSSGIYKSTDEGRTWTHLTGHGLPHSPLGKINLAIAPSDPQRVYAMIETGDGTVENGQPTQIGVLWMSDNSGASWTLMNSNPGLQSRTQYFNRPAVSSDNPNEIYFCGNSFLHSLDAGRDLARMGSPGGDNHDMWIDPNNASNMAVANDSGISISHDRGAIWNHVPLPIAQIYHVATDNDVPYHLFGNKQDGGSYMGPSQTGSRGFGGRGGRGGAAQVGAPIPSAAWTSVGGGESGWAQPDPADNNIVWSSGSGDGSLGGVVTREDLRTGQIRNVEIWPDDTLGAPADQVKYRFMWEFPLMFSPFDHNTVYAASQVIHVTHDGGASWQVMSPDLTRNDKSKQGYSGGLTRDNIGVQYFDTVFSVAESPKQKGLIWAGTNDGLVQLTRDDGKTWTNLSANLPGKPEYGIVSNIEPSYFDASTAYLTVDAHQMDDRDPYVYRTTDYGATWTKITDGLPTTEPNSYAHEVIEDPNHQGLLFLGTEGGVFVSFDAGDHWQSLQNNLPHVPVYGLTVQKRQHDLDIATYGRGFWILDDITPLEQLATSSTGAAATLFPIRPAYEFRGGGGFGRGGNDATEGNNPPAGPDITYYLPQAAEGRGRLSIVDAAGKTVRTLAAPTGAGLHRVWWDMRGTASAPLRLYTMPPHMPSVTLNAAGWRNVPYVSPMTLSYPPGAYTVKLTVGGQTYSQPLELRKDPRSPATPADFAAQFKLEQAIYGEFNQYARLLDETEAVRVQLRALGVTLRLDGNGRPLTQQAQTVDAKLVALEAKLFKNETSGQGEDEDRQAPGLGGTLDFLYQDVASADYPPTQQEVEVNQLILQRLAADRAELGQIESRDVAALNAALAQHKLAGISVAPAAPGPQRP
ncbi:MAG: glycosyl hydrolase [Terriglobales bacterium]